MSKQQQVRYHRPQWQVIADNLVEACLKEVRAKRRRIAKEKAAEHRLFTVEARVKVRGL